MEDRNDARDELDNMDEPSECDMYAMYVKDIITGQPASTVAGGSTPGGHTFFKTVKQIGLDSVSVFVARKSEDNGFLSFTLEVTIVREKKQGFFSLASCDFKAWCDPLPELYDILREKVAGIAYGSLKSFIDTEKSETEA